MRLLFISALLSLLTILNAQNIVGKIQSFNGTIKVKSEGSIKKKKVTSNIEIQAGDLVTTSSNSSIEIKLIDGSLIVLAQRSTIHFTSVYEAQQIEGKVLYSITSRDAKNSLKIKTPFAVIGIKGTKFIIDATEEKSVTLKEGLIGVTSLNAEFELYRKKLDDEFSAFKAQSTAAIQHEKDEFEKYKKDAYTKYEKPIITKEFDLHALHRISFDGKKVKEDAFADSDKKAFEYFEQLIEKMK
jgi:hypothetical protein